MHSQCAWFGWLKSKKVFELCCNATLCLFTLHSIAIGRVRWTRWFNAGFTFETRNERIKKLNRLFCTSNTYTSTISDGNVEATAQTAARRSLNDDFNMSLWMFNWIVISNLLGTWDFSLRNSNVWIVDINVHLLVHEIAEQSLNWMEKTEMLVIAYPKSSCLIKRKSFLFGFFVCSIRSCAHCVSVISPKKFDELNR